MNFLALLPRNIVWPLVGGLLCLCVALADVKAACAQEAPRAVLVGAEPTSPPLASWYNDLGRRDRIVQICVLTGAFALFVIMKKVTR